MSADPHDDAHEEWPQAGRKRLILPSAIGTLGTDAPDIEMQLFEEMQRGAVFMMGDNPALPRMPDKPTLLDFFRLRFGPISRRHHCLSARLALESGQDEKIVMACFLHDISNGALVRCDHGYWSAQLVAPYVDEEVAWAIRYHQPLRYFADESVGYKYPEAYKKYFGADYEPPEYIRRDWELARATSLVHVLAHDHAVRHLRLRARSRARPRPCSKTSSAATSASRRKAWGSTAHRWRTCGAR